jgi:hypothetical protein
VPVVIRLIETHGPPTEFDGKFVAAYDPTHHPPGKPYCGGILRVTDDPRKAMQFPTIFEAVQKYRQSYRLRPDGRPNRPLSAWNVEFINVE